MSRGAPISDENCHPSGAWSAEMQGECEIAAGIRQRGVGGGVGGARVGRRTDVLIQP